MARRNDSQQDSNTPSRVYKSSDVHKRRVDRKGREKGASQVPAQNPASQNPAAQRPDPKTAVPPKPETTGSMRSGQSAQDTAPNSAVVITPEFGRRSEAQREADDRWFAAMREGDDAAPKTTQAAPVHPEGAVVSPAPNPESAPEAEPGPEPQPRPSFDQTAESQPVSGPQPQPQPEPGPEPEPGQEPSSEPKARTPLKRPSIHLPRKKGARIALIVIAIVVVVVAVAGVLFAWNRWYRFDDHADMQGEWYVVGTTVPVTIGESSIRLTDDVTYQYEINAHDKTIRYTFGPMEGQGRYWFSDDRQHLVITDGDEFTSAGNAVDDLLRTFTDLTDKVSGSGLKLPEGEGIIAFSREPDADALAKQQAEAERKAAEEAAERKAAEEEEARIAAEEAAAAAVLTEYYYEEALVEEAVEEAIVEEAIAEEARAAEAPAEEAPAEGSQGE